MRASRGSMICALLAAIGLIAPAASQAQVERFYGKRAARATELPLGAWGPYVSGHSEPCYLADRLQAQLFAFPIVIGQRRFDSVLVPQKGADGKSHLVLRNVSIVRRSMGLSPTQAEADDKTTEGSEQRNSRHARIIDADPDGLLWSARIPFASAGMVERTVGSASDQPQWGSGSATIEFFPGFAAPDSNGLVVRISITNSSAKAETWYTDLLGGMATLSANFLLHDLVAAPTPDGRGISLRHPSSEAAFSLAAAAPYAVHSSRVDDSYFAPDALVESPDAKDGATPRGLISDRAAANNFPDGLWALTRVDNIAIPAGATVTFNLCIGKGANIEAARKSASILSNLATDVGDDAMPHSKLYTMALKAHADAAFRSGDPAIDRLIAQSLTNAPFKDWRRIGVASRMAAMSGAGGQYRETEAGAIALAWAGIRPDFSAAELNGYYRTQQGDNADFMHASPGAPVSLFALWELYQQTHDHEMLRTFYPAATRSYRAFALAGRTGPDSWLFSWSKAYSAENATAAAKPASTLSGVAEEAAPRTALQEAGARSAERPYDVDYSAYVIRAARIMALMAEAVGRSESEVNAYRKDAEAYVNDAENAEKALKQADWIRGPRDMSPIGQDLLAFAAGSNALSEAQRMALRSSLETPSATRTPFGLAGVTCRDPQSVHGDSNRKIDFFANWVVWKGLLDLGLTADARHLADDLLTAYGRAAADADCCPEYLNAVTGAGSGASDYSGFACALIPLRLAYHRAGTVSAGFDISILDRGYNAATDTLKVAFRSSDSSGSGAVLCVLGKPNAHYVITGSMSGPAVSDSDGVVTITAPKSVTSKAIEIAPLIGAK